MTILPFIGIMTHNLETMSKRHTKNQHGGTRLGGIVLYIHSMQQTVFIGQTRALEARRKSTSEVQIPGQSAPSAGSQPHDERSHQHSQNASAKSSLPPGNPD